MAVADQIRAIVLHLPPETQQEALAYIEFLQKKVQRWMTGMYFHWNPLCAAWRRNQGLNIQSLILRRAFSPHTSPVFCCAHVPANR